MQEVAVVLCWAGSILDCINIYDLKVEHEKKGKFLFGIFCSRSIGSRDKTALSDTIAALSVHFQLAFACITGHV